MTNMNNINWREHLSLALIMAFTTLLFSYALPRLAAILENRNLNILLAALERLEEDSKNYTPFAIGRNVEYFYKYELYKERVSFDGERTILFEYKFWNFNIDDDYQLPPEVYEILVEFTYGMLGVPIGIPRNRDVVFDNVFFDNQGIELFRVRWLFNTPITVID